MNQKFWLELIRVLEQAQLADDPRFADPNTRHENIAALNDALDPVLGKATTAEWLERLEGRLPVAPVYDVGEALSSPFVESSGMVQHVPHPQKADLRLITSPIKVNGTRARLRPCPALGADNDSLLGE